MSHSSPNCILDETGVVRRAFWPTANFSDISNFAYTEDPDVVILNGPGTPNVGAFRCSTQQFLWIKPLKIMSGVTYNPHTRRVFGYAEPQRALVELDVDTGEVVRELSRTELGPIGRCTNVRYATSGEMHMPFKVYNTSIEDDPELVMIADSENHIAGMLRLSTGRFVWRFGEYGVRGSDLRHLSAPRDVTWTLAGGAWIADYENHRLLGLANILGTPEVTHQWIFPRPTSVGFTYNSPAGGFFSANAAVASEGCYQPLTLVLSDFDEVGVHDYTSLLGWVPIASNLAVFNPWDPTLLQVNQWNSAFEVEWMKTPQAWRHMTRFAKHYTQQQSVSAGESWSSEPVVGLLNDRMLLRVFTTAPARLRIEVPEPMLRLLATPANFHWAPAVEVDVPAGRMLLHAIDPPPSVFRASIEATCGDMAVSVYVEGL